MADKFETMLSNNKSTGLNLTGFGFSEQEADILLNELKSKYKKNKKRIKLRINH